MRNTKIHEVMRVHEYTLKELSEYLGLHYSTISLIAKRVSEKKKTPETKDLTTIIRGDCIRGSARYVTGLCETPYRFQDWVSGGGLRDWRVVSRENPIGRIAASWSRSGTSRRAFTLAPEGVYGRLPRPSRVACKSMNPTAIQTECSAYGAFGS